MREEQLEELLELLNGQDNGFEGVTLKGRDFIWSNKSQWKRTGKDFRLGKDNDFLTLKIEPTKITIGQYPKEVDAYKKVLKSGEFKDEYSFNIPSGDPSKIIEVLNKPWSGDKSILDIYKYKLGLIAINYFDDMAQKFQEWTQDPNNYEWLGKKKYGGEALPYIQNQAEGKENLLACSLGKGNILYFRFAYTYQADFISANPTIYAMLLGLAHDNPHLRILRHFKNFLVSLLETPEPSKYLKKPPQDIKETPSNQSKDENAVVMENISTTPSKKTAPLNQILYGPPGTGKTYGIKDKINAILKEWQEGGVGALRDLGDRLSFVTFHPSYGYEEFIEGIRPDLQSGDLSYTLQTGAFKALCEKAKADEESPYFMVIDEINRGNVASIFGELITLIEDTKRLGTDEAIKVKLPYSGEEFGVPSNVYIIATMNTADRSLTQLDSALRRRFVFEELPPRPDKLEVKDGIDLKGLLEALNAKIQDKNQHIGHAFFMGCETKAQIIAVMDQKVIPLLREYYFDDDHKIQEVLGGASDAKTFVERFERQ